MPSLEQVTIATKNAQNWLQGPIDKETRVSIEALLAPTQRTKLVEAFLTPLSFGTGGVRARMGVGCSRINRYSLALITQGLATYLSNSPLKSPPTVVVAYDSRLQSDIFAQIVAEVLSANNIGVHIFRALRPTPLLSFAVRRLGGTCGLVITASHNPKDYNGYKLYDHEGAQLVASEHSALMDIIAGTQDLNTIAFTPKAPIQKIESDMDEAYLEATMQHLEQRGIDIKKQRQMRIIYSPLYGTGITLLPNCMRKLGYDEARFQVVATQSAPNGHFPGLLAPNPEERASFTAAIKQAHRSDAQLIMTTDPDADRIGIALRDETGMIRHLNGHQTAALILDFLLRKQPLPHLKPPYVVKTVVTSELLRDIAKHHSVSCYDTLTGFKYISQEIANRRQKETFLYGGEESYGHLIGDFVRDKDAISVAAVIACMAEEALEQGRSLLDNLAALYLQFGCYEEALYSITKEGTQGRLDIQDTLTKWRTHPPTELAGEPVARISDYQSGHTLDLSTQKRSPIHLPKTDMLQFFTTSGSKVSLRPSGTEPKLKAYISLHTSVRNSSDIAPKRKLLQKKIETFKAFFNAIMR